jgi:hypothetical protein
MKLFVHQCFSDYEKNNYLHTLFLKRHNHNYFKKFSKPIKAQLWITAINLFKIFFEFE